jgi:dihydrolipoamide dehydrogenase
MATGRKPRTAGLGLETLGVTLEKNGAIPVNDHFQLPLLLERAGGEAGLYTIGDANGRQMLAHAAEMQAVHAVNHILGKTDAIRFDIMPAAIFTEPEAACVGPTEDQLKEQGIPYECHKAFWRANGKALAIGETKGMLKLFITPPSQGGDGGESRILGCHAFGAHAADIVQEVSVLMCRDTTVAQLRDMVHIHPTLGEILVSAVL